MKKILLIFLVTFGIIFISHSQTEIGWKPNLNEVKFVDQSGEESILGVDPGLRYANLQHQEREYRLFHNRNDIRIKNIRIVDLYTNIQIARGKGSYFWGNSRIEFVDGEILKLKRKNNPNGYTIIGPYGELFKVENQAISPVKTYEEKDFITQAFFTFRWIITTQKPPQDVVMIFTSLNSPR